MSDAEALAAAAEAARELLRLTRARESLCLYLDVVARRCVAETAECGGDVGAQRMAIEVAYHTRRLGLALRLDGAEQIGAAVLDRRLVPRSTEDDQ